jgi:hypothetical protein
VREVGGWQTRHRPSREERRLLWILGILLVMGCSPSGSSGVRAARKTQSNAGGYTVTLEIHPDPIPLNQPFDVILTVVPTAKAPSELDVQVDARMPAHFHGMNRIPRMTRTGGDSWKAEGLLFHMPGSWELYVDITQGGATERAQLDVDLK